MATYRQISEHIRTKSGFVPKTCWIAHVLSDNGLTKRIAHNRTDRDIRLHACPASKRAEIESALRDLSMI